MTIYSIPGLLVWLVATASCGPEPTAPVEAPTAAQLSVSRAPDSFPPAPKVPDGPLSAELAEAVKTLFGDSVGTGTWGEEHIIALQTVTSSNDPRVVWLLADMLRISSEERLRSLLSLASFVLLDLDPVRSDQWGVITNHLIAWDIPAPPGYLEYKRNIFTLVVPEWERIFQPGDVDWRLVTWGGVGIDNRAYDTTDEPCNCIPAADNPAVTSAEDAKWLDDDDVVFGLAVGGQFRAYPRQIMEVREMVNDTLGGRDIGMPYCTLCASAQAYFTDGMPDGVDRPVLRTSGLLIRSNKLMYDVNSYSVFDTFLGDAVTGPLAERKIVLPQAGVVTTTWGEWKRAHPTTTVLAMELSLGRDFDFRNGRDADGPIFPIGDLDQRMSVHDDVVGVITASGKAIAFPVEAARAALEQGEVVGFEEVMLRLDAGGLRAVDGDNNDVGGHQAFWFAWSQFHPGTLLWGE